MDPELARAARARLPEIPSATPREPSPTPRATVAPSSRAAEPARLTLAEEVQPPPSPAREPRHTGLSPVLLLVSVFVNIVLISLAVSDARVDQPSSTSSLPVETTILREASGTPPNSSRRGSESAKKPAKRGRTEVVHETTGAVERKVLGVVIQDPTGKLPPRLIDSRTGLAKNNLQAVCRTSFAGSFLCVVRPVRHRPTEGLYVRYRPTRVGREAFAWYRYRSG